MRLKFVLLVLMATAIPQTLVAQTPRTETSAIQADAASSSVAGFPISSAREGNSTRLDFRQTAELLDSAGFPTDPGRYSLFGANEEENKVSAVASPGEHSLSNRAFPNKTAAKSAFRPTSEPQKPPRQLWRTLIVVQHGAAVFDAWSTRDVMQNRGAHELNPLYRPFASSGLIYAATQVGSGLFDYLGYRMMKSKKGWMRRLWWVPQVAGTVGSLFSGAHNLTVAQARSSSPAP